MKIGDTIAFKDPRTNQIRAGLINAIQGNRVHLAVFNPAGGTIEPRELGKGALTDAMAEAAPEPEAIPQPKKKAAKKASK